jgi:hypothetical protein
MQPVNFAFSNPSDAILGGIKQGAILGQIQQEAQARQQAMALAQQKQQAAMQQQADLRALAMNPNATHADYARVTTLYPDLAENLGKSFKMLEGGQQQNLLNFQSRVYSAQLAGDNGLAVEMLRERAKADPSQQQHYDTLANLIEKNPAAARSITALGLAGAMGPEKFAEAFAKIGGEQRAQELQPGLVRKGEADADAAVSDATIKGEQAKVAPQTVLLDLQKKGWDIEKIKQDIAIAKEDNRIKAMTAAISREGNDLKRQELRLKVQEAQQKLDDAAREKVAKVESARTNMDNMLNTADRFLAAALDQKTGKATSTLRAAAGPVDSKMPTMQQDVADLEALIENMTSQAFLSQVPNMAGMGQLSDAEGQRIASALQNLTLKQSPEQLVANVKEAQRLTLKGRKNLTTRYGVPESTPDTPAAAAAAGPDKVQELVDKYLGKR